MSLTYLCITLLYLFLQVIPMKQIKTLNMDASLLTNLELTVLLAEMRNLEDLTLRLTPEAIINFNVPIEEDARVSSNISLSFFNMKT